jgi:hypothetical protein
MKTEKTEKTETLLLVVDYDEETKTLSIEWDEHDQRAIDIGVNNWTEEEWLDKLKAACDLL